MKKLLVFLLTLVSIMQLPSCQKTPVGQGSSSVGEATEESEPQRMAYHFGPASLIGDDIYFVFGSSFSKAQVFASEYGSDNFEAYIPCFDVTCIHRDRTKCCVAISLYNGGAKKLSAFLYNDELSLVLFDNIDICISKPYLNFKTNLVYDSIVNADYPTDEASALAYMEALASATQKGYPLVYGDYLYYVELKNGIRTQYRISLAGGEPERVFEDDNIVIKTIINDRFYGIRYDEDIGEKIDTRNDRDKIHYFRSDMNYENVETLPEILDFFEISREGGFYYKSNVILDADSDFIYVLYDKKVWKILDTDIYAEPILLYDLSEKLTLDLPTLSTERAWYNDGVFYMVTNTGNYDRPTLNRSWESNYTQWYEKSEFFCFDFRTGEYNTLDISSQSFLIREILYADDKYVYAEGRYVHDDNRAIQGVTIRLTLDTMRYEVILPDDFWEYSADTAAK